MKIGVICPSEIAFRRFMPALQQCEDLSFAGIGVYTKKERIDNNIISNEEFGKIRQSEIAKARAFVDQYGGKIYDGYEAITLDPEIDALYIPLPPALHYKWAKKALKNGKHVLVEKPATTSVTDTEELIKIAAKNGLVLHENYMFVFHRQLEALNNIIANKEIGDVRLYRVSFGFPRRANNDFRYNKSLGGGALLDAGGYTIKYASLLLGPTAEIKYAQLNYIDGFEVDMFGSAALVNEDGVTVQIAFGMDNEYKCDLEVWGNQGCLKTGRVLTAPAGFRPTVFIKKGNEEKEVDLPADDAFLKSIKHFVNCMRDTKLRNNQYGCILKQAVLVDEFLLKANEKE